MKLAILTSQTPANVWLVNQIMRRYEVVGMVIEAPKIALARQEKIERRRRMLHKHGIFRTLNKLLYNWLRSRILGRREGAIVRDSFFPDGAAVAYLRQVPTVTVQNINDAACIGLLKEYRPEVIAVCGTSVIRPEVFTLAAGGTVNIHTGITPEYRSADPIFWALYNKEPDKVGVTVHFIDQGIDTGPIIHQESVPLYSDDSMASIYARCIRQGSALYLRALEDIERGSVRIMDRSSVKGRAFYSIRLGIIQYFIGRWRFRSLRRRLPPRADAAAAATTEVRK